MTESVPRWCWIPGYQRVTTSQTRPRKLPAQKTSVACWCMLEEMNDEVHVILCVCIHTMCIIIYYNILYIHTYMHTCIHAYMHTCIHAYMHTCIHAYMHTCIHASIHPYIQQYNTIQIQIQYNTNTNTIQYKYNTQYNTIQYNTIQYNTIQSNHTYIHTRVCARTNMYCSIDLKNSRSVWNLRKSTWMDPLKVEFSHVEFIETHKISIFALSCVDRSLKRTSSGGERCRAKRIQTGSLRKTLDGKLRRSSFLLSTGVRGCTYLVGQSSTWSLWNNFDTCSLSLWREWEQQKPGRQGDSIVKMLQICGADGISHFWKEEREDHDKTKETIGHRSTCAGDWRAPAESWCDAMVVLMVAKKLSTPWETQRNRSQYRSQWCNGLQWPPHIVENQRRRMFFLFCAIEVATVQFFHPVTSSTVLEYPQSWLKLKTYQAS